ncbi:MAG: hypothetical protein PHE68_02755 [Candidatus Peribacteraceae bacterium]|nr:hypothetical protein [Candidatus Peribacteraceae bacterium]MDD5074650.1 hypothetical protein [Candidatus Peribacteraceae bacterium]
MVPLSQPRSSPEAVPSPDDRPYAERSELGRRLSVGYRLRFAQVVDDGENLITLGKSNGYAPKQLGMGD